MQVIVDPGFLVVINTLNVPIAGIETGRNCTFYFQLFGGGCVDGPFDTIVIAIRFRIS